MDVDLYHYSITIERVRLTNVLKSRLDPGNVFPLKHITFWPAHIVSTFERCSVLMRYWAQCKCDHVYLSAVKLSLYLCGLHFYFEQSKIK